jgi:hypothetical protein
MKGVVMSNLPDIYIEKTSTGQVMVVANEKARHLFNKASMGNLPQWSKMADGQLLTSPEFRAIEVGGVEDGGYVIAAAMVSCVYAAGLRAMVWCENCRTGHLVDDAMAKTLWAITVAGAGALPTHATVQ